MKTKNIILSAFLTLLFISCENGMFIKVDLDAELRNQAFSLIDYDIVLARSGTSDKLYFEFIINKELDPNTIITFFDESGSLIATKTVGTASNLINDSTEITNARSFVYSIGLDNLRSYSLVEKVTIGKQ